MAENPTPAPAPAPAPSAAEIITKVVALDTPEKRRTEIAELIKERTVDDLEALAKEMKSREELKDQTKLEEFKEEIKKRIESLRQSATVDQALTMLEGKVALLELLPQLGKKPTLTERVSNFAVDKFNAVIGWFKGAGGWIGETATSLSSYLSDPAKRAELGRTIGNFAKRGWYWLLKTPSLIGIPENTPGLGKLAAGATEKLAQMDAMDAIYEIVNAEKGNGAKPLVTFDGKFDKGVWLRWKPEERTPEGIQRMTLAYIDAQKKAKKGTEAEPIAVTMAALKNPEEAAKVAAETFQATLATNLGVEKIIYGTPASARKEATGKWSITITEGEVDKPSKKLAANSTAEKLLRVTQKLSTVNEVVVASGKEEIEVRKEGDSTKVSASMENLQNQAVQIESLAKTIQGGRVIALKIGDPSLKTDVPRAVFSQANRMLATNTKSMTLGADKIAKILSDKIPAAADRQEWKWDGSKWMEETLPTA